MTGENSKKFSYSNKKEKKAENVEREREREQSLTASLASFFINTSFPLLQKHEIIV